MLRFIDNPYISAEAGNVKRVIEYDLYYLCVGPGSKFAIEIIKGAELVKPLYENRYYRIIGVAGARNDAFLLVRRVVEDFIVSGNGFDTFGDYLRDYEGEQVC